MGSRRVKIMTFIKAEMWDLPQSDSSCRECFGENKDLCNVIYKRAEFICNYSDFIDWCDHIFFLIIHKMWVK